MKTIIDQAKEIRSLTVSAAYKLSDEDSFYSAILFDFWQKDIEVTLGSKLRYNDKLYKVVQGHTTQEGWEPDITPALFTEIPEPGQIPIWKQPLGVQDAYQKGDKVMHLDRAWESVEDNNVWEPGVYGWI